MESIDGVLSAKSGYTGGRTKNPTYRSVTGGSTGHYEAVEVTYDSSKVTYETLLYHFWRNVDPLDPRGQFCDKGSSYRSGIFCNEEQCDAARSSKKALKSKYPKWKIATKIVPAKRFYDAEDYHQDYYIKNPSHYAFYKKGCRRAKTLKRRWGNSEYKKSHAHDKFNAKPEDPVKVRQAAKGFWAVFSALFAP